MNIFVLIIVLVNMNRMTTVTVEFSSFKACETARTHIVSSASKVGVGVVTHGCHPKGDK